MSPASINNTFGFGNYYNIWGNGNYNIYWGDSNNDNILGNNNGNINCVGGMTTNNFNNSNVDIIFGLGLIYNTFLNPVSSTDFTSATHIYGIYTCEIYEDATLGLRLRYTDNDTVLYADITD